MAYTTKFASHVLFVAEQLTLNGFPDDVIVNVLLHLPQKQRATAALCCRRWAHICATSQLLWQSVALEGLYPPRRAIQRVESFLAWLVPRAAAVQQLTITERRGDVPLDDPVLWANCVAAITLLAPQLRSLTLEVPVQLVLSQWVGTLRQLQLASFASEHVVIREGLDRLTSLTELRVKSSKAALALQPSQPGHNVLPVKLLKLRLEGCNLTTLPPAVACLTALEDLVLSDNTLRDADMSGLSRLVSLRQLTLMGCRMRRVPSSLSHLLNLQVLYLDMGVVAGPLDEEPVHLQLATTLEPLRQLGIISLGACYLQELPAEVACMGSLRALYLDDNCITALPEGAYLRRLRVLGIDWRVLLTSHHVLLKAPRLFKLCLMSMGKEVDAGPHQPSDATAVITSLTRHPSLQQVLLPQVDGQRCQLHLAALNIIIGISRAPHLQVAAVGYQGIDNEWLQWLEEQHDREKRS